MTDSYQWPPTVELRRDPASVARHLAGLREVVAGGPTRGVIYVGGGRYWPGIVIGVHMLRAAGCSLPVEVWHRGDHEPVNPADVAGLGVRIIDIDALGRVLDDNRVDTPDEYAGGWEAKLYAITHTQFDQVLYLDADAYCVANPASLFEMLNISPFVFWHDLPAMGRTISWGRVWPAGAGPVPTVQGGQLVIDRRRAARLIRVAHWICQHSDYYFGSMYGDQDAWRVALAATGHDHLCLGAADWERPAFVCRLAGVPLVVHRCQDKLYLDPLRGWHEHLPGEAGVRGHFGELFGTVSRAVGASDSAPPHTATMPTMAMTIASSTAAMQPNEPPSIVMNADLP